MVSAASCRGIHSRLASNKRIRSGPYSIDSDLYDVCSLWAGILRQVNEGVVTGSEIRTQIQAVYARAHQTQNRNLRAATAALLRAATERSGVVEASRTMTEACRDRSQEGCGRRAQITI